MPGNSLLIIDSDDPDIIEINNRVRTWGGNFVKLTPEFYERYRHSKSIGEDHPIWYANDVRMRVGDVDWNRDWVHVWWANLDEPWKPYRIWLPTEYLELVEVQP